MKKLILVIIAGVILQQTVFSGTQESAQGFVNNFKAEMMVEREENMQKAMGEI